MTVSSAGGEILSRKAGIVIYLAALMLALTEIALGQGKQVEQGPIPAQIATAKRVFIANAAGDDPGISDPLFGGVDRAYNQFYAAMKRAERYELVGSPAEADLLFEIRFTVNSVGCNVIRGDSVGTSIDPQFRLEIRDSKTNALLWAFTEHIEWAILQGNRSRNFDQAAALRVIK